MRARSKTVERERRRDFLDWIGATVDLVQAIVYVVAVIAALYWYVAQRGGLPAVVVGLAVGVVSLLAFAAYVAFKSRKTRQSS